MGAMDDLIGRQRDRWGVFERPLEVGGLEVHVAPLRVPGADGELGEGDTEHVLFEMDCWCRPRRDSESPNLIVHEMPS